MIKIRDKLYVDCINNNFFQIIKQTDTLDDNNNYSYIAICRFSSLNNLSNYCVTKHNSKVFVKLNSIFNKKVKKLEYSPIEKINIGKNTISCVKESNDESYCYVGTLNDNYIKYFANKRICVKIMLTKCIMQCFKDGMSIEEVTQELQRGN